MTSPTPSQRRLLENHHAFTAWHRAEVIREPGLVRWQTDSEWFRCVLLETPSAYARLPADASAVRTFPWSAEAAVPLEQRGFAVAATMRYMSLPPDQAPAAAPMEALRIAAATNAFQMAQFSDVQAKSFADPGEDVAALEAFLHGANLKNLNHPSQTFYVGHLGGQPVTTTLLVEHERAAGIYAVATLPDFRRKGLSRQLLVRAIADARRRGCEVITLQVYKDSEAERLYRHLGFAVDFDCTLWAKK